MRALRIVLDVTAHIQCAAACLPRSIPDSLCQAEVERLNREHVAIGGDEIYGLTPFLDIPAVEFRAQYLGYVPAEKPAPSTLKALFNMDYDAVKDQLEASSFDWRSKGVLTPIKNQAQCGSCWAFATVETIESANAIAGKGLRQLAPEQLVDCDHDNANGCSGGDPSSAYSYVQQAGGVMPSSSYPYTAGGGFAGWCKFRRSAVVETIAGHGPVYGETAMAGALQQHGPLGIVVDASSWQYYSGGVMRSCGMQTDHAVQLVGFTPGTWIVRNSWGAWWGESGYIELERGVNMCALTTEVNYAVA